MVRIINKGESKMTVNVYKPTYKKAGFDAKGDVVWNVTMSVIGQAKSYENAKAKYGVLAIVDGYAREMEEE